MVTAMATYNDLLPATATEPKGAGFKWTPGILPGCGVLVIEQRRAVATYTVAELPTRWEGRAFQLSKIDGGTDNDETGYSVFICRAGQDHLCGCKGFSRWHSCKHVAALVAAMENRWL
ncbi:MAG: hypothetical protein K8U57_03530 [Planctomycetes bacterium]|nr:hypothetical protein [Planctomycetota bacterium]